MLEVISTACILIVTLAECLGETYALTIFNIWQNRPPEVVYWASNALKCILVAFIISCICIYLLAISLPNIHELTKYK